jgi:hypothetical protein
MVGASGTLVLVGGAGAFLGPTLVAAAIDIFGPSGFFWSLAMVHALIGVFILYRMTQRSALPADEQGSYAVLPRTTAVVGEMFGEEAASESLEDGIDDADQTSNEDLEDGQSQSVQRAAPASPSVD